MAERRRSFDPTIKNAPIVEFSAGEIKPILEAYATWSPEEKRPVTTGEFVAASLPEAARRLGIEPVTDKKFTRPSTLRANDKREFAAAYIDQHRNKGTFSQWSEHSLTDDMMIAAVRTSRGRGIGAEITKHFVDGSEYMLGMIEAGKIIVNPNKPETIDDNGKIL